MFAFLFLLLITVLKVDSQVNIEEVLNSNKALSISAYVLEDSGLYLLITLFYNDISQELKKYLIYAKENRLKYLILDLRDNIGGNLDEAVSSAGYFAPKNYKLGSLDKEVFYNQEQQIINNIDIFILINKQTASAAEFFAGALRSLRLLNPHIFLVGQTSFGKSKVTELETQDKNMNYILPNGQNIQNIGLAPDIKIDSDTNLLKLCSRLHKKLLSESKTNFLVSNSFSEALLYCNRFC